MPLPIPNLDDTQFQTMVTGALTAIPRYAPEWTDYNLHDPGMTFIDLLAWLAEMQQYYLSRVPTGNYLRFLDLLGVRPAEITPAATNIAFTTTFNPASTPNPLTIPQGAKLSSGTVVFETQEPLTIVPAALQKVFTVSSAGTRDNSEANKTAGITYMAFGDNAENGSALYLGFTSPTGAAQPFAKNAQITLTMFLSEDYPVARGSHGNETATIVPSARILWEYYGAGDTWKALSLAAVLEPLLAPLPSDCSGFCDDFQIGILNSIQQWPLFAFLPLDAQKYLTTAIQGAQSACALRALATDPELLALSGDETVMLSRGGRFSFTAPDDMKSSKQFPNQDAYFWIRARVAAQGYELPPRVNQILPYRFVDQNKNINIVNTVTAIQTDTRSEVNVFSGANASQSFPAATLLTQQGDVELQIQKSPGVWQQFQLQKHVDASGAITYTVTGQIPPQGAENIRLIACPAGSQPGRFIGKGNGLPNQQFPIVAAGVVPSSLMLQTSAAPTDTNPIWQDWIWVDNFNAAGPGDYQFIYDAVNGVVRFGDGVNGATPPRSNGPNNVRWIQLRLTQGSKGNVSGINSSVPPFSLPQSLTWNNVGPAIGGADAETLAAAELRARRDLNTPYRLVTEGDYEYVTLHTPGLRVARAHAIPLYDPSDPSNRENTVTVVVVPYSTAPQPTPSEGFLQTVCRHLDMHRLVTTKIKVIAPQYIRITVQATVALQAGARVATVQQAAIAALQRFLNPLRDGASGEGWPFGRAVYVSEIYQVLDDVAGLSCVQALSIAASGAGAAVAANGDVRIPPESLVVSGNHAITVSPGGGVCPPKGGVK
jgi:hypothetical protein